MIKHDMRKNPFCRTSDWHQHLSDEDKEIPEAKWLEWSRAGKWATYLKIGGQRSAPWWKRSQILAHFKIRYGVVRADLVAALEKAGFEAEPPVITYPKNLKNTKRKARS